METIPSRKRSAPGDKSAAGRPFRIGDVVESEEPAQQQTEPTPVAEVSTEQVIGIRYPTPGTVINYAADLIEEGTHFFKLLKKVDGKEPQIVAIYNKHTGAIIEAFEPFSIERNPGEPIFVPGDTLTTTEEPNRGFWSRLFRK